MDSWDGDATVGGRDGAATGKVSHVAGWLAKVGFTEKWDQSTLLRAKFIFNRLFLDLDLDWRKSLMHCSGRRNFFYTIEYRCK